MARLDFSSQAAPVSPALDFSHAAMPIDTDPAAIAAFRAKHAADVPLPPELDASPRAVPELSLVDRMRNLSAGAGDAITGSLIQVPHALAMASGGLNAMIGLNDQADADFGLADRMQRASQGYQRSAQEASPVGATAGNILGIIPKMVAPEVLAVDAMSHGTDLGTRAIRQGESVPRALALQAEGQAAGTAQNLIPGHMAGNLLTRVATGAAINGGLAAGEQAAEHATAPGVVEAPSVESTSIPAAIGAILAATLGHGRVPAAAAERLVADPEPMGLPRGADFSARAESVRPDPVDLGGAVHVDARGNAATPAQGAQSLVDAIMGRQQGAAALPEPVVAVDSAGRAATTADQNAAMQQPPPADLVDALGLTDAQRALIARDPRSAREGLPTAPPALPAPSIAVDPQGNAMTSADFLARAQQALADAEAQQAAQRSRADLGITPDIERTQSARWELERQRADDLRATQDARDATAGELSTQGQDDAPPWWLAAYGADPESMRTASASGVAGSTAELDGSPAFSFAGAGARTADRAALDRAQQMEAMGRDSVPDRDGNLPGSPEATHMATGWHRGTDGRWRFEIDDSQATINNKALQAKDPAYYRPMLDQLTSAHARALRDGAIDEARNIEQGMRDVRAASNKPLTVGDILDHSQLFDAYPQLADVAVSINPEMSSWGSYSPRGNRIEIRSPADYEAERSGAPSWTSVDTGTGNRTLKSVLLHEIQHAIQYHEGFARGGSSEEFLQPRIRERQALNARIDELNTALSEASRNGDHPAYERVMRERRAVVQELHEKGLASDIDIHDRSFRDYHRLAGEVEARNTQTRLGMSSEERRATPPTETADVSRDKQLVRVSSQPGEQRAQHDDVEAIGRLSGQLSTYLGRSIELAPAASLPDTLSRALDQFGRVFGGRVIVFENRTPDTFDFQGVTLRDGKIFLNADSDAPLLTVAGHETLHQMRRDRPDLYEELADEVRRQGRIDDYLKALKKRAAQNGEDPSRLAADPVEELTADAMGDAITDPDFMEQLAQRNPSLFRRLADYVLSSLQSVISRLAGLGSNRYLEDVKAFRDRLASVLERYAEHQQATRPRSDLSDEPVFSRKPTLGEGDELKDMPSRRPGESQSEYLRRVANRNGDEIKSALALAKAQRDIGRLGMRAMWAKQDRSLAIADAAFAEYRKLFDKEDQAVNLRTIDQWENGQPIGDFDARRFFELMREAFDQRTAKIQALAPDAMQQLIEHYFPHIWEDTSRALKWYQGLAAKRPLQGDRSFLKQRTHATIKDGMATGLKPVSTNPVDLAILKLQQMDKFIAFHEFRADLQQRGWLKKMKAGERVPAGYARVDDPAFQIAGGLQGYYAVPELIARDINNYLSPSLYRFGAWKALRTVQNVLMSSRLGLSMFHGGFTTMDNLVMHADVAGHRLLQGDLPGGLATLLKTPLSIVWSPVEGGKLNKQWLGLKPSDQHTAAVLDMLEQGGAHMKMSATDYNNAIPKLVKAIRQKSMGGTLKQTLPAISEAISWVIHHKLVPAQKMAARVMLAKFELDRISGALGKERGDYAGIINAMHPDALKQVAAHVVNLVDDRLGQMNYDNQFWNKTAREASQALIGAVGWQVGTLRTVTGGVRDLAHLWAPPKLLSTLDKAGNVEGDMGRVSGRLTYLVTLALLMGGLSAITQYLMTGEGPTELKDYFFPRTGNRNEDGSDERLQWPSYWSDHYKLATHPLQTAEHKINPSIGMLMEALSNQDYYGTEIRDPDASWWKQAEQVGEYLAKGFIPYSITGADKIKDAGTGRQVANFFGVTRAPASVSRTRFEAFVAQKAYDAMPQGARSKAQADHAKAMHEAEAQVRRGEEPTMEGLSPDDRRNVDRAARMEVPAIRFRRLSIEDKLRAYDLATPAERERYKLAPMILRSNWRKAVRELPPDEQDAVIERVRGLIQ